MPGKMPAAGVLPAAVREIANGALAAAAIGLCVNLLYLIVPFYTLQLYNRVISSRSYETLVVLTVLTIGVLLFLATLDYIRSRVFAILGERMAIRLGAPVLSAAVATALRNQAGTGSQAVRDLQDLRQFITSGPVGLPLDLLVSPLFLAVLFLLHPAYGVAGLLAAAYLGTLGVLVEILARRPAALSTEAGLRSQVEVSAAVRHAEIIEAMGMLPALARRWRDAQRRTLAQVGRGQRIARAAGAIAKASRMALQVSMLATGAALVIQGAVSSGSIVAATIIMGRLLFPFEQMIEGWRTWCNAIGAFSRLKSLLVPDGEARSQTPMPAGSGSLLVDRLSFVPPGSDRPVLRNLNFALATGEALGIVGPSGAGKSTLARLIVGLWRPTVGDILLDGHNTFTWERTSFGRAVGYLPQNAALLDGTVRDNIARFDEVDPAAVILAAKAAGVHELIGRLPLGYETRIGEGGCVLSAGQRQRLALARALFGCPRLLVLDEPNSSLDVEGEQAFMRAIADAKATGITILIVAQRMSILGLTDHLLVLRDGAISQFGPRLEVLREFAIHARNSRGAEPKVAHLPIQRIRRS